MILINLFWIVTIFLAIYAYFYDFPFSGDLVLIVWGLFYFGITFYGINNKTKIQKNSKSGNWEEVTIEKSIMEQESEIRRVEAEARKKEQLRQKKLKKEKLDLIKKSQKKEREKVFDGNIPGSSLMGKVKRLKKLYINGTLTKGEFEQAKNRLLD
tara:strand:- start:117 stop:581 length:465 start_codon:yes stop_codon:yes gene_type:complete